MWATDLVRDLPHSSIGWSLSRAHGLFEALPVVDPASRRLYLKRCEQVLDRVLFDFSPEGVWKQRQVPGTNITCDHLLSQDSYPEQSLDPDCGSGAPLEFIAHDALHSGDWDRIIAAEAEIARIFHYLEVVSDWAWMAGSARDAFLDTFPSPWMGHARIGRVLAATGVSGREEQALMPCRDPGGRAQPEKGSLRARRLRSPSPTVCFIQPTTTREMPREPEC